MLHFLMFMNLTIHDTKRYTIKKISSPIHYLDLDSITMQPTTIVQVLLENTFIFETLNLLAPNKFTGLVHQNVASRK